MVSTKRAWVQKLSWTASNVIPALHVSDHISLILYSQVPQVHKPSQGPGFSPSWFPGLIFSSLSLNFGCRYTFCSVADSQYRFSLSKLCTHNQTAVPTMLYYINQCTLPAQELDSLSSWMHAISYAHFCVPKLQPHPYHPVFIPTAWNTGETWTTSLLVNDVKGWEKIERT